MLVLLLVSGSRPSSLALLVARVGTDHHDPAVPADHPALAADPLHARLDLHGLVPYLYAGGWRSLVTCTGRRSARGSGRTAKAPPRPGPRAGCGCSSAASCR